MDGKKSIVHVLRKLDDLIEQDMVTVKSCNYKTDNDPVSITSDAAVFESNEELVIKFTRKGVIGMIK